VAVTTGQVFLAIVYGVFGFVFMVLALRGALLPPDVEVRRRRLMAACFAVTFLCWGGILLDWAMAMPTGVWIVSLGGLSCGLIGALLLLRGTRAAQ
jgi:hypothetical protein